MKTEHYTFRHVKFAWDSATNSVIMDFGATCETRKAANRRNAWHLALHSRIWYFGDVIVAIGSQKVVNIINIED